MVVIHIETKQWNTILDYCIKNGWNIEYKYDQFDAGIDYDLIVLKKGKTILMFGWDNWIEGEIQGPEELIRNLTSELSITLKEGLPTNLKPSVVKLYYP